MLLIKIWLQPASIRLRRKIDRPGVPRQDFKTGICRRSILPVDCWALHSLQAHRIRVEHTLLDGAQLRHLRGAVRNLADAEFRRTVEAKGPRHARIVNMDPPRG